MRLSRIAAAVLSLAVVAAACDENPVQPDTQVAGVTSATFDAHDNNNKVDLRGPGVKGTAIINFSRGGVVGSGQADVWKTTVNIQGNLSADTYTFGVNEAGGFKALCSFTVPGGRQGCNTNEPMQGFATAELRNSDGDTVASGSRQDRGPGRNI